MKKLIVFMLAAFLVSCSQQETLEAKHKEYVKKESKEKDYSEQYKNNGNRTGDYYYERSLDTIRVSGEYVIVAVYRCRHSVSTVIVGKQTRLD